MSYKSAKEKLGMHGTVICSRCNRIIITCATCPYCKEKIYYDFCDDCENVKKGIYES